jgi:hypothetical protein
MNAELVFPTTVRPAVGFRRRSFVPLTVTFFAVAFAMSTFAKPVPENLGGGLRELLDGSSGGPSSVSRSVPSTGGPVQGNRERFLRRDAQGNLMVRLTLDGSVPQAEVVKAAGALPGARIVASTDKYQAGAIEAFIPAGQLAAVTRLAGVRAVVPAGQVFHKVGTTTTHGVALHRVNRLPAGANGAGITIGVLSDSYDTSDATIRAAADVASGDLPGPGNPLGNTQSVVVLEDLPAGTDEGRGMLQIIHDVAPKARLGFATSTWSEITFADNIRSLAGLRGASHARAGFKADVIVDDVGYYDAPFFEDGIGARAVDEVADAGVAYFSSAGNTSGSQSYDADLNLVPATRASYRGTNLDFTHVDPALYAGGFHNFAGPGGLDIAQTITFSSAGLLDFQWNEPYDSSPKLGAKLVWGRGTVTVAKPAPTFTFKGTAGQPVLIFADADSSRGNPLGDVTLTLYNPDGEFVDFRDTGTVPESMIDVPEQTGTYTVVVEGFDGSTGDFSYSVRNADVETLASDFNLLFFNEDGSFLTAFAENNLATNRPLELAAFDGAGNVQLVIARANKPSRRAKTATHIRYISDGSAAPREYFSYLSSATWGHPCARGAIGVGAYADYLPSIPQYFTSPGPVTIYFDRDSKPLSHVETRQKPDLSAMDGANTTFFGFDSDGDGFPNFYGTSASAPHAAAIGALALQAAGGSGSLTPDKLRRILQNSAFPHDLDPFYSTGAAKAKSGRVELTAFGDDAASVPDPNTFLVENTGGLAVTKLTINLTGANTTEIPPGLIFDERVDLGLPFTIGSTHGIAVNQIQYKFAGPANPPGQPGQWKRLAFTFDSRKFDRGDSFSFGVDRDEAATGSGGNSADLLGANFSLETGAIEGGGATVTGVFGNGETFSGLVVNKIGDGYTALDGYGFINAEQAVKLAKKK